MTNLSRTTRLLTAALAAGLSFSTVAYFGGRSTALAQEQEAAPAAPEKPDAVAVAAKKPEVKITTKDAKQVREGVVTFAWMVEKDGTFENPGKRTGSLLIQQNLGPGKAVEFDLTLNGNANIFLRPGAYGDQAGNSGHDPAAYSLSIQSDLKGYSLTFVGAIYAPNPASKSPWVPDRRRDSFQYWPADSAPKIQKQLIDAGLEQVSISNRKVPIRLEYHNGSIRVYADNALAFIVPGEGFGGPLVIHTVRDAKISGLKVVDCAVASRWVQVPLNPLANDRFGDVVLEADTTFKAADGTPFTLVGGKHNMVNMKPATWIDGPQNLSSYFEGYDSGSQVMNDPRMPMVRVPVADYTGAHVLAYSVDDPATTQVLTMRAGSYDQRGQTLQHDFASRIGKQSELAGKAADVVDTKLGKLQNVFVPFTAAFAQDLTTRPTMEIELAKEIHLARRTPDPNRFRYRPIGQPSGVRIAAITLEKSPLQIKVASGKPGHVFEQPVKPKYSITLENITQQDQTYDITVKTRHLDGDENVITSKQSPTLKGFVPAGQTKTIDLEPGAAKLGYYDIAFEIDMPGVQRKLIRRTTYGVLPPDTRKNVATSPFGTWDFTGGHYTSSDPEQVGPLYKMAGLRYGMFRFKLEDRVKYGVLCGNEPKVVWAGPRTAPDPNDPKKRIDVPGTWTMMIDDFLQRNPDAKQVGLILHENSISGNHVQRVPDVFTDRPIYKFVPDADPKRDEKTNFEAMFKACIEGARAVKAKYPDIHLRLGNGPLPTKEEFLRNKFPAELFDSAGNESGTFGRAPEAQPPDYVAFGASIWMDRQMLDYYGYKEKPVTQCYEICYPNTNPGNLTPETQADYFVRHAMHALIWGIPEIRMGCISDVGNSYRYSNWGASGLTYKMPELNIKPAYISYATMTRMLDGAKLPRSLETGSESVYAMEFDRPEPNTFVSCVWSLTGPRQVVFEFTGALPREIIDAQGNRPDGAIKVDGNKLTLTLGPRPFFLTGDSRIKSIVTLAPSAPLVKPDGALQVLVPSPSPSTLAEFKPVEQRDAELEGYNFMTPRRKGNFELSVVKATGAIPANAAGENAIKVTPKPLGSTKPTLAMPMYSSYTLAKPVEIKGEPTGLAIAVKGNTGWGRIIFEMKDASGQNWRHLGAAQRGELSPWLLDWMPKEMLAQKDDGQKQVGKISDWNTDDVWGASRINFDGWKYIQVPLPGTFQGDYRMYWPTNSQWKFDKDGIVHYPLTLTGITVEIPEKVLKLNRYEPVADPSIQFGEILAVTRPERWLKPRSASNTSDPEFDRLPLELTPRESD